MLNRNIIIWVFLALGLLIVFSMMSKQGQEGNGTQMAYSSFIHEVKAGRVISATITNDRFIVARLKTGDKIQTTAPNDPGLIGDLLANNVEVVSHIDTGGGFGSFLMSMLPLIIIIGIWIFLMRRMQGGAGGGGAGGFGKSKAKLMSEDQVKVRFKDVAGCDEAKQDVEEVVDFLRDPDRFSGLGGKVPRGLLMVGPPGTGKTLLARAIAGESKASFLTTSGSEFVEMFVGVGASRVRDMFEQAKKNAPAIIFIDEIDAVGRHRGAGMGGGHDEREQTLNQLLVEMDGFEGSEGVIIIAATNRPDVLDPALLRPGRFDRQVTVGLPDVKGREQILQVHMRKVRMSDKVNPRTIARGTPGFSGADLANLVNEAALMAARLEKTQVEMDDFEKAKDKIMMGAEKPMVMSKQEKKLTAYHEAGHAIAGFVNEPNGHDPVHKVSIIPRGRALGVTMFLPEQDRYSHSKKFLEAMLEGLFGGRAAEELIFGQDNVTTGASNDIERATEIAKNMVTKWGLSNATMQIPRCYSKESGNPFLGKAAGQQGEDVNLGAHQDLDSEINDIIRTRNGNAVDILRKNEDKLHAMAEALLKYETIDRTQIEAIMAGKPCPPPEDYTSEEKAADDADMGETPVDAETPEPEDDTPAEPASVETDDSPDTE